MYGILDTKSLLLLLLYRTINTVLCRVILNNVFLNFVVLFKHYTPKVQKTLKMLICDLDSYKSNLH